MDKLPDDFDPIIYLSLHADVKENGMDPGLHYLLHGAREGRPYKLSNGPVYDQDGLRSVHNHEFMQDPAFMAAYARGMEASGRDFRWHWRVHTGLWAARLAIKLDGDFVECGVGTGFMSSAIMHHLNWNTLNRNYYLLDTFSGIDDRFLSDAEKQDDIGAKNAKMVQSGVYVTAPDGVIKNFSEWPNKKIIVGAIPETLDQLDVEKVAFLHLDMNNALPEIAAIEYLWDRIVPHAPILLDDYAYDGYRPQKLAMDAFASSRGINVLSLPTGQGLMIKPPA